MGCGFSVRGIITIPAFRDNKGMKAEVIKQNQSRAFR